MIWIAIVVAAVVLDQAAKFIIMKLIPFQGSVTVIDKFFYLTHWKNKGAAWGIFQNGRYFFIVMTIIVVIIMAAIIYRTRNKFLKFSLALIIGGALGNFIDRLYKGSVTDFLLFQFGSYQFPIFNVADSIVVVGTILLAIYMLFIDKKGTRGRIKYKIK